MTLGQNLRKGCPRTLRAIGDLLSDPSIFKKLSLELKKKLRNLLQVHEEKEIIFCDDQCISALIELM